MSATLAGRLVTMQRRHASPKFFEVPHAFQDGLLFLRTTAH
jgi:hypothetical protein